ncbi:MAG: redoxin domain-containing protein [Deltaproteobacteria bacterium]
MNQFEARKIKVLGISKDSAQSHRDFIAKHALADMTLLSDEKSEVIKLYGADHWLLPVSRRVYIIMDKQRNIVYRKDTGFDLLPNQTQTLVGEIDRKIP